MSTEGTPAPAPEGAPADQNDLAARMAASLKEHEERMKGPPRKPDPKEYGWSDGKIRNTYDAELIFDRTNDDAGEAAFPEWLDLPGEITVGIYAFSEEEARELAHKAGAAVLRGLGIPVLKEDAQGADGATVQCFFQGDLKLKEARVLPESDVFEFFGDVPLYFQNHYKRFWTYEGRKDDRYKVTLTEVDDDHRYSVDVKKPLTLGERYSCAGVRIVDELRNLVVFEGEGAF